MNKYQKSLMPCIFVILIGLTAIKTIWSYLIVGTILFCLILYIYLYKKNKKNIQYQRDAYIATLSHDLKIPALAQIRALELLLSEKSGNLNDAQKELLTSTLESCNYLNEMLSIIISSYKFENNKIKLVPEEVKIDSLINTCFTDSLNLLKKKNINIKIKSNSSIAYADKIQITIAFKNIIDYCISNAFENTEIICNITSKQNFICISLSFENPLVSSEQIKNLFNEFHTATEKLDKVGSGLTLYLAKQIIDAHKGSIEIETRPDNINTYSIELPVINNCKIQPAIY